MEKNIKKTQDIKAFIEHFKNEVKIYDFLYIETLEENLNQNFLNIRKLIINNFANKYNTDENILLDPEYNLQCLPSIDAVIFNISDSLKSLLLKNNIRGIKIASFDESMKLNDLFYAIGYNETKTKLHKYENYRLTYNFKTWTEAKLSLGDFINDNKSASLIHKKYDNNYIFTNISSLSEGSSGAPILNQDGKLIGMSIAYYQDQTDYEEIGTNKNLKMFDKNSVIENKENYLVQKNSNLALSINHKIFEIFLDSIDKEFNRNYWTQKKEFIFPKKKSSKIFNKRKNEINYINQLNLTKISDNIVQKYNYSYLNKKRKISLRRKINLRKSTSGKDTKI